MDRASYGAGNERELGRLRALVDRLGEADLARPVNEGWTVAGVLGHIAFWDGRALALTRRLTAGGAFTAADHEPEEIDWVNDASTAFIHALPPTVAARAALSVAEETDRAIAELPPDLAARAWPLDADSPLNLSRADHRGEHLDEIEAALDR